MKDKILGVIQGALGQEALAVLTDISVPDAPSFGHYSTNVALRLANARGTEPLGLAKECADAIQEKAPAGFFEKVEAAAPGFINFWLSKKTLQDEFQKIAREEDYGTNGRMKGETVMIEFTDPNPFKLFHIGHLMSNTIGESLARLHEAAGAKVIRANYEGDVGLHVAKAVWGMEHAGQEMPDERASLLGKVEFLGVAYAFGSAAYERDPAAKERIVEVNEKIYAKSDPEINKRYDVGRAWSLAYFETLYRRLGTKFDEYFFESEMAKAGAALVLGHKDIFIESEGAVVFPGERYGLHTRVFINSKGIPTYEAKELGLNKKKFELHPELDASIIVTGNEVADYFKVLLRVMEFVMPEVRKKTRHIGHGMLRLPTGKMSSRTGDVITADALIDELKEKLRERVNAKNELSEGEREEIAEGIALGAIKYSILKQNPGQDIVFDFGKSLSVEGDSGPYLQYAHARLRSIVRKAADAGVATKETAADALDSEIELHLIRKFSEFPDAIVRAQELCDPSGLAHYLYKLSALANQFYETMPILKESDAARRAARVRLTEIAARTLRAGLGLLGMRALEKV